MPSSENAFAEHESGRAVVPGKPDESELLTRILSHDKDEVMPPPKAKKPPPGSHTPQGAAEPQKAPTPEPPPTEKAGGAEPK